MSNLTRPPARPRAGTFYDWDTEPTGTWPDSTVGDDQAPLWSGLLQGIGMTLALTVFVIGALAVVVADGWPDAFVGIAAMAIGVVIGLEVCAIAHAEQNRENR